MSSPKPPPRQPAATRRRGSDLEHALLRAAAEELRTGGYATFTMEHVAIRAGTNKNALYRRWPNRAALALAALRHLSTVDIQTPDSGELRADVLALLRGANSQSNTLRGSVLRAILPEISQDAQLLAQLREQSLDAGSALWLEILGRAVARGELQPEVLKPRVATVGVVLLRNELMLRGTLSVDDHVLIEICDLVYLPLVRGYAADKPVQRAQPKRRR